MFTTECPTSTLRPDQARARFRGGLVAPTSGWSDGYAQAEMISVPSRYAVALRRFAVRNPRVCPLLDIVGAGRATTVLAKGADLRRDLPAYRVWRRGEVVAARSDVSGVWSDDLVTFLLGSDVTFEAALRRAGVPLRHLEQGREVPVYRTSKRCTGPLRFRPRVMVSMRPVPERLLDRAAAVTGAVPYSHGAPVHAGRPSGIGVKDLARPDHGDAVDLADGDVPVFWASGVTLREAVVAKLPFAITHEPGHLLVTDRRAGPG